MASDLDKAFELAAEWEPADYEVTGVLIKRPVCPDCKAGILPSDKGYRCLCSQWRLVNDPADPNHRSDRRKLHEDEL